MNTYYVAGIPFDSYNALSHHGIKGQKWGIRRYQNPDGTLTTEGIRRYRSASNIQRDLNRADKEAAYITGDYNRHSRAEAKLRNKAMKIINKSTDENGVANVSRRNSKKLMKMAEKAQTHLKEAEYAKNKLKEIESNQHKLMGEAINQGYSVLSTKKNRSTVRKGEQALNVLLYGGIGAGIKQVSDYGVDGNVTRGNKFKVSKSKSSDPSLKLAN